MRPPRLSGYPIRVAICAVFAACSIALAADESNRPFFGPPLPSSTAVSAIPLEDVPEQAESATANLRDIQDQSTVDNFSKEVDHQLPLLIREVSERHSESSKIVGAAPSLEMLRSLERSWIKLHETLADWIHDLLRRTAQFDAQAGRLALLQQTWEQTLKLVQESEGAPQITNHVQSVIASIARTRNELELRRARTVALQNRVTDLDLRVNQALASVRQARERALSRIFDRDSPAIWEAPVRSKQTVVLESSSSMSSQWRSLIAYLERQGGRFGIHFAVWLLLTALFFRLRHAVRGWVAEEASFSRVARVLDVPAATALLTSILAAQWIYPEAPRLMWAFWGAAALVPTVIVLRRLLHPRLFPLLDALVGFYFFDQIRRLTAAMPVASRYLFAVEMAGAVGLLAWRLWTARRRNAAAGVPVRLQNSARALGILALATFTAAFVLNAVGFVALSRLLGDGVLRCAYLAVFLFALSRILDMAVLVALRARPLASLNAVSKHWPMLWARARWFIDRAALALWGLGVLGVFAVRPLVFRWAEIILTTPLNYGKVSISLSNVLELLLTLWAATLLSRFIRFVLEEEVFPHANLPRGIPYAISTLLHYAILVVGTIMALAAVGLDMTKFTILAGAFGVGLGFGLQNVINNFFSGLILLFERPIKVGDVIQIDDQQGVVERIGIRASTIRTPGGYEVIVPNGNLISGKVLNWTLRAYRRSIQIPVSAAPEADPANVIHILQEAAKSHPSVLKTPEPRAMVTEFSAAAQKFELSAWTDRTGDWYLVKSELIVAISQALARERIAVR